MEKLENVSYYIINKTIELAKSQNNINYLVDYDKLLGLLLLAQSEYAHMFSDYLIGEDFCYTPVGLKVQDGSTIYNHNTDDRLDQLLRMRLVPFEAKNGLSAYDKRTYDVASNMDMKAKVILDDILIRFGELSAENLRKYIEIMFSAQNEDSFIVAKNDLATMPLQTGADAINAIVTQISSVRK